MILYYAFGKEAVESLEEGIDSFLEYIEENSEALKEVELATEVEKEAYIKSMYINLGPAKYSILTEEEVMELKEQGVI